MPTRHHRVNIIVTEEQHALLADLAKLDPEVRSSAAFVRELLDQVTPLLRQTVPLMKAAAKELSENREQLRGPLREFLAEMQRLDLLDLAVAASAPEPQRSEDGRARRKAKRS